MSLALRLCLAVAVSCVVARNVEAETQPQGISERLSLFFQRDRAFSRSQKSATFVENALTDQPASCRNALQLWARTELYVGAGRHAGARDQKAWRTFLARVVTPRFPNGLTVLEGAGQWRGPHGVEREHARVIILIYRPDARSDQNIDAIREAYKKQFKQKSVLRTDTANCVSF